MPNSERGEKCMGRYSVHVFCNECSEVHPMGVVVELLDGPPEKASIGDTYAGKELPMWAVTLVNNRFMCPNKHRFTVQAGNDQVFLVPISD
jgi:hypothetical protein